jgi:tetratricopeptide (TPR) repeat protein
LKSMISRRLVLLPVVLACVVSCAFFNIYWMARNEYDRAISHVERPGFWDPYSHQRATGEQAKLVESALKRCGKLLLLYPESKWVDDSLLLMGNCFLLKNEYGSAIRKYDELLNIYATSEFAGEAKYMKAYTLVLQGSTQQALTILRALSANVEQPITREKSIYVLGRIQHETGNLDEAIARYETYLADFPKGARTSEVRLSLATCLLRVARPGDVMGVLEPLVGKPTVEGAIARLRMGRAYRDLEQNDRAIEVLDRISARVSDDTLWARAQIEIAQTLLQDSKPEDAVLILAGADSLLDEKYTDLKAEANYGIAVIYEKHLGDFESATASYEKAVKSKSDFGKHALKRSKALKAIKQYQETLSDSVPDTPEEQAMNRFLMAETYLEDLGLRQRALEQYEVVTDSFPSSEFAAKAMLRAASLVESEDDTVAGAYYRKVLDAFPNTVYANIARARRSPHPVCLIPVVPTHRLRGLPRPTRFQGPGAVSVRSRHWKGPLKRA